MLRPDTQALWGHLKDHAGLGHFVLVGGTALTIHLGHRVSEDLDFMIPTKRLPRRQIEMLKRECAEAGFQFVSNDSPAGLMEFEDTGMDYNDYQQDYTVGGAVKLTLVAPDPEVSMLLNTASPKGPRVATLSEIFSLKCVACANRTKSRDWLDMYVLLNQGHFQPYDIYKTFKTINAVQKFDIAMRRMTTGKIDASDEGYESLMAEPPSISVIQDYFREMFSDLQTEIAACEMESKRNQPRLRN